jgi:hypothetical protein
MLYHGQLLNKFEDLRQTGIIYHGTWLFYDNNSGNPIFYNDLTVLIFLVVYLACPYISTSNPEL